MLELPKTIPIFAAIAPGTRHPFCSSAGSVLPVPAQIPALGGLQHSEKHSPRFIELSLRKADEQEAIAFGIWYEGQLRRDRHAWLGS